MGLQLTGKGSIWDHITHAIGTGANVVAQGARDVGNVGSLATGVVTGNQQAQTNAKAAIAANSHQTLDQNAAAVGQQFMNTAKGLVQPFQEEGNALLHVPQAVYREAQNKPIYDIQKRVYGTTDPGHIAKKILGDTAQIGLTVAAPAIGDAITPAVTGVAGAIAPEAAETTINAARLGLPDLASTGLDTAIGKTTGALTAGAVNTGFGDTQYLENTDKPNIRDLLGITGKSFATGTALGVGGELAGEAVKAGKANLDSLGEEGALNPKGGNEHFPKFEDYPKPGDYAKAVKKWSEQTGQTTNPEAGSLTLDDIFNQPDTEARIHAQNPNAPVEPVTTPEPAPVADKADLRNAEHGAHEPPPIDYTKVEGAGKRLTQAIKDKTDTLRSMDASSKGGQLIPDGEGGYKRITEHTPFYSKFYAENGHAPRVADYKDEAERLLRAGSDAESQNYHNLQRHANAEQELKTYQQADKASGYNKVKVRDQMAHLKKGLPAAVLDKISSPEYEAKAGVGKLLQRINDELDNIKPQIDAIAKERKRLAKAGDITGMRDLASQTADLQLRYRQLQGMKGAQGAEYGRAQAALDDKYPDTALYKDGKAPRGGNVTVSGEGVKGGRVRIAGEATAKEPGATQPYDLEEVLGHPLSKNTYDGPNLNADAFTDEDIKKLEAAGLQTDNQNGLTYSPERDMHFGDTPQAEPRNLAGDTAAFESLQAGKPVEEAVKAYQDATGATAEEAAKAVNLVADTGQGMQSLEEVLKRNPAYKTVNDLEVNNVRDASDKAASYSNVAKLHLDAIDKEAAKLSEADVQKLDAIRGRTNDEAVASVNPDNPEQFKKVADLIKQRDQYNHEIRRLNGDDTVYRTEHGAGMHYSPEVPEDRPGLKGYRDTLQSTPGFSNSRHFSDYGYAQEQFGLQRKNANIIEDLKHDTALSVGYSRERSIARGLEDHYGGQSVSYGNPDSIASKQLNGTRNIFATPEIAKEWNKLHPQAESDLTHNLLKPFDAATSLITQATVANPAIHGSNLLTQGFIAAGKIEGAEGGTAFLKNLTVKDAEEAAALDTRRLEAGDHIPTYGKDNGGIVSKLTSGISDVNKKAMSALDNNMRRSLFKTLTDDGMTDREAVQTANKFMGDTQAIGTATRRFTFFYHFFKTQVGAIAEQVAHPAANKGTILNTAIAAGAVWATNKAFQEWTGNKHAHVHVPGELGIAQEAASSAKDVVEGHFKDATNIVTNRVNPIIKEGAQQLFNKDLFTGQDLSAAGRASHAINAVIPEAQLNSKVQAESKSAAEAVANFMGVYTPHAKGAPAAPSDRIKILNTTGAKPATGPDKTGIDAQNAYFDSLEHAKSALPAARQKVYDAVTAAETDPNGNKIGMNEKQARAHYDALASNPDVLKAIVEQKRDYARRTGQPVDPLYDPKYDSIRQKYMLEQSTPYKGDDYTQIAGTDQKLFQQLGAERAKFFSTQDFTSATPSQRIVPPSFDAQTESDLNTAGGLTGTDKADFIAAHPNIVKAYDAIAKYTNDRRTAQGFQPFKLYPKADPATQASLNAFFALPKKDGPNGTSPTESAWIKGHPAEWAQVQDYLANVSEFELANSAGADKYLGATPSQQELKSAYSLGKYDINKSSTGVYTIDPQARAASESQAKSAFSGGQNGLSSYQLRATRSYFSHAGKAKGIHLKTASQNRRVLLRVKSRGRGKVHVASAPKTGSLRIKLNKATV